MFKAPILDYTFKGKTFNRSDFIINFIDDTTARLYYYSSEAEYAYRVDSSKAKIYLETQKININGTWLNREECIEMLRSEYPDTTDEQLNIMLLEGFSRNEIGYYINPQTGEVMFCGTMYDKPEDYLVNNVKSFPVYEFYTYKSENLNLQLEGCCLKIFGPAQDNKDWIAISVNDGKITYTDEEFTGSLTIPYEFKTSNVLTITYEGQSYDLSMSCNIMGGTLSDGSTTPDEPNPNPGDNDSPSAPENPGNDPAEGDGGEGSGAEDSGSKIESDLFIPENAPYDFGTGCEYDKGIGFDASSLKAGDIITLYYSLGTVENEWGVYSQLKISYGYSGTCLPSLKESANEYGQVLVEGVSYSFKLSEDDIAAISSSDGFNRMMIFGHNVILSKITKK